MPELTEEQTRAALAGLRAETLPLIQPPGSAAAARTVRRRRRTGVATVALGVVSAIAAGAFVVQIAGRTSQPPPPGAATPSLSPSPAPAPPRLSDEELKRLEARAKTALGLDNVDNRRRRAEGKPPIVWGTSGIARRAGRVGMSGGSSSVNESGVYVIEIVCLGAGSLMLRYWGGPQRRAGRSPDAMPPADARDLFVPCGAPTVMTARVLAPQPNLVYASEEFDEAAVGRAAFALLVREA